MWKINEKGQIETKDSQREGGKYAVVAAQTPPRRTQFPARWLRVESHLIGEKKGKGEIAQLRKSIDPIESLGDEKFETGFCFSDLCGVGRRDGGDEVVVEDEEVFTCIERKKEQSE